MSVLCSECENAEIDMQGYELECREYHIKVGFPWYSLEKKYCKFYYKKSLKIDLTALKERVKENGCIL